MLNQFLDHILEVEGGYINDPKDSGGETNYGITVNLAREYGYNEPMRDMKESTAREIYAKRFWHSMRLDDVLSISEPIAKEMLDTGVNQGVNRAVRYLQRSLNVFNNGGTQWHDLVVDGIMGSKSLTALRAMYNHRGIGGMEVLYRALNCLQGNFYIELAERREKDEKFIYGWFRNRVV